MDWWAWLRADGTRWEVFYGLAMLVAVLGVVEGLACICVGLKEWSDPTR
jgi:hypothetical protein